MSGGNSLASFKQDFYAQKDTELNISVFAFSVEICRSDTKTFGRI